MCQEPNDALDGLCRLLCRDTFEAVYQEADFGTLYEIDWIEKRQLQSVFYFGVMYSNV